MNMKRLSKDVRVLERIKAHIKSLGKRKLSYQTRKRWGSFVLMASIVLGFVGTVHLWLVTVGMADPAYSGLWSLFPFLILSSGFIFYSIGVEGHSPSPRERRKGKMLAYLDVHMAYYSCMFISILQFAPNLALANGVPAMPYLCLWILFLVEITAMFLYLHDHSRHLERGRPSRWWIRTTPYPIIGLLFLLLVNLWNDGVFGEADFSLFFSVAVSMLAVNYLVQIINERIVPKEGPYKKTHMAVYNRSVHARPAYHRQFPRKAHVRRPKPSSSSTGRGEGAC